MSFCEVLLFLAGATCVYLFPVESQDLMQPARPNNDLPIEDCCRQGSTAVIVPYPGFRIMIYHLDQSADNKQQVCAGRPRQDSPTCTSSITGGGKHSALTPPTMISPAVTRRRALHDRIAQIGKKTKDEADFPSRRDPHRYPPCGRERVGAAQHSVTRQHPWRGP